jgi:hypothetical protein
MREYYPSSLQVPRSLLQVPLAEVILPARMAHYAKRCHARFLGHLDLMPEWQITRYAGSKCFEQLQDWLDRVRLTEWRNKDALPTGNPDLDELIRIPPNVRALTISNPPFSGRLCRALQTYGLVTLGNLDGLRFRRILTFCNIGPRSLAELREVLGKIAASLEPEEFWATPGRARVSRRR